MRRSARQLEEPSGLGELFREGLMLTGATIARNPVIAGGTTAFLVAMAFVTANAVWYQPYQHPGAFFATRAPAVATPPLPRPEPRPEAQPRVNDTTILIERETTTASVPGVDPQVRTVQEVLQGLKLYSGTIDGLAGPQTERAIQAYQQLVGLEPTGQIDASLLKQLGTARTERPPAAQEALPEAFASIDPSDGNLAVPVPVPVPLPRPQAAGGAAVASAQVPDPHILRVQAGLKAFGNDGIELDGVVGPRTRSAIREFQSLFGLPETGEPDAAVYAKMREIGLTD